MDVEKLEKLVKLRDDGIITDEDFQEGKARLLSENNPPAQYVQTQKKKSSMSCLGVGCLGCVILFSLIIIIGTVVKEQSLTKNTIYSSNKENKSLTSKNNLADNASNESDSAEKKDGKSHTA